MEHTDKDDAMQDVVNRLRLRLSEYFRVQRDESLWRTEDGVERVVAEKHL